MLPVSALFVLLIAAHQQQVADAWWPFASAPASAPAPAPAPAMPPSNTTGRALQAQAPATSGPAGPFKAVAKFDMDGVKGFFRFSQENARAPTLVEYELDGLRGHNKLYHVHVRPVPKFDAHRVRSNATAIGQLCADPATGGHLNPHHITEKLPPKSAPLDKYELGDLSGKHGPLETSASKPDHYVGSFTDDKLPMSGEHSIVGRSLVIHKNQGARWVCASIEPTE